MKQQVVHLLHTSLLDSNSIVALIFGFIYSLVPAYLNGLILLGLNVLRSFVHLSLLFGSNKNRTRRNYTYTKLSLPIMSISIYNSQFTIQNSQQPLECVSTSVEIKATKRWREVPIYGDGSEWAVYGLVFLYCCDVDVWYYWWWGFSASIIVYLFAIDA